MSGFNSMATLFIRPADHPGACGCKSHSCSPKSRVNSKKFGTRTKGAKRHDNSRRRTAALAILGPETAT
jgi:hypothetical protein